MSKYYFRKGDEHAYTISAHLEYMKEMDIKEMDVFEAKRESGIGFFFLPILFRGRRGWSGLR